MQMLHAAGKTTAQFDDPNLVSQAGLVPAARLMANVGVEDLVGEHVHVPAKVGVNAAAKIGSLLAGMVAGADHIDGMDLLRHGALPAVCAGIRAPSTLGSFLRAFTLAVVAQLAGVHRRLLPRLVDEAPRLLAGSDQLAFIDIDSIQRRVYGRAKQGARFGHAKIASKSLVVRGLNALVATVSTPTAAPVVAAARLRGGNAASGRGAARLIAEAINTAREAGVTGRIVVRADSAYYSGKFISACHRAGAYFSVTVTMNPSIARAIEGIDESAWTPIRYPQAVFDEQAGRWVSDAEIAEIPYTAFAGSRRHRRHARLIVRRVRRLNPAGAQGQDELFSTYRYHAVFTDSPFPLAQAEPQHRGHAVIEQTFADLLDGPLAHLPSGDFAANAAWLQLAVTAHAITRTLGVLASTRHAVARGATIRTELITVAARPARGGRDQITWHLPEHWPWQHAWQGLFAAVHSVRPRPWRRPPLTAVP